LTFLSVRGDRSGLITAIGIVDANMLNLNDRLVLLNSQSDEVWISNSITAAGSATTQIEGVAPVVSLIDGIAFTVLSSVLNLAVAVPPVIGGIATHTVGLFQQRIETIVTLVNTTSSSSHEMFDEEARGSFVSGDTLFYRWCIKKYPPKQDEECGCPLAYLEISPCAYPLLILTSPIWLPALLLFVLIYRKNNPSSVSWSRVQCQMKTLSCQNDALAASLPSL
jgi:hypothetical protein